MKCFLKTSVSESQFPFPEYTQGKISQLQLIDILDQLILCCEGCPVRYT